MTARAEPGSPSAITLPAPPRAAIISPLVDALSAGGLSLLVLAPLLLLGRTDLLLLSAGVQAWLGALVNLPHFLASYRMVYRTRASIGIRDPRVLQHPSLMHRRRGVETA